jgi:hypothetical protein
MPQDPIPASPTDFIDFSIPLGNSFRNIQNGSLGWLFLFRADAAQESL